MIVPKYLRLFVFLFFISFTNNLVAQNAGFHFDGLNNSAKNNIKIYPNPTHDRVYLEGFELHRSRTIFVYDVQGNLMLTNEIVGSGIIDLSALANGIYVIQAGDVFQRVAKM